MTKIIICSHFKKLFEKDMDESLIDPVHGHGSQSLINLLITGHATQVDK